MSRPRLPYVLFLLDGPLALYAGVSPHEPIGEPVRRSWDVLFDVLEKGYEVRVMTWRDPGLVWAWLARAQLMQRLQDLATFDVVNDMPQAVPRAAAVYLDDMATVAALPRRT